MENNSTERTGAPAGRQRKKPGIGIAVAVLLLLALCVAAAAVKSANRDASAEADRDMADPAGGTSDTAAPDRDADTDRSEGGGSNRMTDYMIIVNSETKVPSDFVGTVNLVTVKNDRGSEFRLEEQTWLHYLELKKYLADELGITVDLDSAYRDEAEQQRIWDEFSEEFGEWYAEKYAAVPGTSEHHTGLALDVCLIKDGRVIDDNDAMNAETEIFGQIYPVLPRFGFIHRYSHECWHYRYVGSPEMAQAIADSGLTLEQYEERYGKSLPHCVGAAVPPLVRGAGRR